jgi:hypothetical protein
MPRQPTFAWPSLLIALAFAILSGCGGEGDTERTTMTLAIENQSISTSGETTVAAPSSILLVLSGPDGVRTERIERKGQNRVHWSGLSAGWWTLSADGFDEDEQLISQATRVRFEVKAGERVQVKLVFQPIEE